MYVSCRHTARALCSSDGKYLLRSSLCGLCLLLTVFREGGLVIWLWIMLVVFPQYFTSILLLCLLIQFESKNTLIWASASVILFVVVKSNSTTLITLPRLILLCIKSRKLETFQSLLPEPGEPPHVIHRVALYIYTTVMWVLGTIVWRSKIGVSATHRDYGDYYHLNSNNPRKISNNEKNTQKIPNC